MYLFMILYIDEVRVRPYESFGYITYFLHTGLFISTNPKIILKPFNFSLKNLSTIYYNWFFPMRRVTELYKNTSYFPFTTTTFLRSLCSFFISSSHFIAVFYLAGSCFNIFVFLLWFWIWIRLRHSSPLSISCFKSSRVSYEEFVFPSLRLMIFQICFISLSPFILYKCR